MAIMLLFLNTVFFPFPFIIFSEWSSSHTSREMRTKWEDLKNPHPQFVLTFQHFLQHFHLSNPLASMKHPAQPLKWADLHINSYKQCQTLQQYTMSCNTALLVLKNGSHCQCILPGPKLTTHSLTSSWNATVTAGTNCLWNLPLLKASLEHRWTQTYSVAHTDYRIFL